MAARSCADFGVSESRWANSTPWAVWVMVPPRSAAWRGNAVHLRTTAACWSFETSLRPAPAPRRAAPLQGGGDGVPDRGGAAGAPVPGLDVGGDGRLDLPRRR